MDAAIAGMSAVGAMLMLLLLSLSAVLRGTECSSPVPFLLAANPFTLSKSVGWLVGVCVCLFVVVVVVGFDSVCFSRSTLWAVKLCTVKKREAGVDVEDFASSFARSLSVFRCPILSIS